MKIRKFSSHIVYAILSIASPIMAIAGIIIFQSIAHSDFWGSIDTTVDSDRIAGAMMAISEVANLLAWMTIGSFIGLLLALKSCHQQNKIFGIGFIALVVNGFPLILCGFFWIRVYLHGW